MNRGRRVPAIEYFVFISSHPYRALFQIQHPRPSLDGFFRDFLRDFRKIDHLTLQNRPTKKMPPGKKNWHSAEIGS